MISNNRNATFPYAHTHTHGRTHARTHARIQSKHLPQTFSISACERTATQTPRIPMPLAVRHRLSESEIVCAAHAVQTRRHTAPYTGMPHNPPGNRQSLLTCLDQERYRDEYRKYKHAAQTVQVQRSPARPVHQRNRRQRHNNLIGKTHTHTSN